MELESLRPAGTWLDSNGRLLPFETFLEVENFLRTAEIMKLEEIGTGITKPRRAYLEKGGIKARAIFRDVAIFKQEWNDSKKGKQFNFRDNYIYECAAYRLSQLLELRRIPPTVRRRVGDRAGSVQLWVESAMMETDRMRRKLHPPDNWFWAMQHQMMVLFDQLIHNDDRNAGNILIDADWKLWLIDHTRAFRIHPVVPEKDKISFCERKVWNRLKGLSDAEISGALEDLLSSSELKGLLQRRTMLVEHIQALIDERGETVVLFNYPRTTAKKKQ
jgi:hypothetical protein